MKPLAWLAPVTPLYGAAIALKNAGYDRGRTRQKKLRGPVISIGNLSTGGGGKTPFAIALAKLLTESGMAVDVLSRGYGRSSRAVERVDPSAVSAAARYGDEPLLIAREAGVPVYVGAERYDAGLLAEQESMRLHLLDDGFQHRQLARDLDIVLVHRDDLTARLLPAGHLREPLTSLERAHVIVLREEDAGMKEQLRRYTRPHAEVWHILRRLQLDSIAGVSIAVCGIARPQEFFSELGALGVNLADTIAFPDHHAFRVNDLRRIGAAVRATGATRILTTAKDLTRLSVSSLAMLRTFAPVESVPLRVTLLEPELVLSRVGSLSSR